MCYPIDFWIQNVDLQPIEVIQVSLMLGDNFDNFKHFENFHQTSSSMCLQSKPTKHTLNRGENVVLLVQSGFLR